ncbi:MAG: hypothetical protein JWM31_1972, partial [Solirubrobacterales bacterium]|nr:hypothetical protein [Solirubrobacterales bacterium]
QGCRQFAAGVALIATRARRHALPHLVVLALGTNGGVDARGLGRALRLVGRGHVLALVTPPNQAATQTAMRTFARRHPDRVLLMDWQRYAAGRPLFAPDGIHPTPAGARVQAAFIAGRAAGVIRPPSLTLHPPRHRAGTKDCGTQVRFGHQLAVRVLRGRDRIGCARARALVRRPPLRPIRGWRWADWSTLPGPWLDVYRRADARIVVATAAPERRRPPAGGVTSGP